MADKEFSLADYGINQAGNVDVQDALKDHVKKCFGDAVMHKRSIGVEALLLRNLRANKLEYQPEDLALIEPGTGVYMGIAALKARAAESWITDIILNNIDKPWTIAPTPDPDLPENLKEQVIDTLILELPTINGRAALEDRARELKSAQNKIAYRNAEKATTKMEVVINDQMTEASWLDTFSKYITDICVYPTALMRGPYVISKKMGSWDGSEYKAIDKAIPVARSVSPFDAFPSPDSSDTQDGQYFCERLAYGADKLYALIGVDGFNAGNIRAALDRYPTGYSLDLFGDTTRQRLEDKSPTNDVSPLGQALNLYDMIILNGLVKGSLLADQGVIVKDRQASYEAEIWLVGDYVVRAVLNPNPSGKRPIYSTSYRKVNGSFWGQGVICLTYDVNRVCNAAARNMVKNMGYSSGPIGEVVSDRTSETEDPLNIQPYVIKLVGPDLTGTGGAAYKFHQIQSVAPDLMNIFNQYLKYADDLSGVPSYVLGNPQVAGAGRTMGGLSMLMGNAAKGIKNVQLNIDRDVIGPLVEGYYVYNMVTSKDDSIKADCKVVARGATGLLQRELAQARTTEILQLLTPYIQQWDTLPDGIKIMLREVLKSTGLPIDEIIPNPNEANEAMDTLRTLGGQVSEQGPMGPQAPQPGGPPAGLLEAMARGSGAPVPLPSQSMPPAMPQAGPSPMVQGA